MKSLPLNPELEILVLAGMIGGKFPLTLVKPEELSKTAKAVWTGLKSMTADPEQPEAFGYGAVYVAACEVGGGDVTEVTTLLKSVKKQDPAEAAKVVGVVKKRMMILDLLNAAGEQLQSGDIQPDALADMLQAQADAEPLVSLADLITGELPAPPEGFHISGVPQLSERLGGVYGMWAFAGTPGCGKTVLALQISVCLSAAGIPVLYYDFENGQATLLARLAEVYDGNVEKVKKLLKNFYYRSNIESLAMDLKSVPAPGLIVIDSIHKLPLGADQKRMARLQQWLRRFESLKLRGYGLILISEIPKSSFDAEPSMTDFKETVDIIYTADMGARLNKDGSYMSVHVLKHRHRPVSGKVATLKRVKSWWFKEE